MRYEIKTEQKGDKMVVRWDVYGTPGKVAFDPASPPVEGEKETCIGQGIVSLPVPVFNHLTQMDTIEGE